MYLFKSDPSMFTSVQFVLAEVNFLSKLLGSKV